MMIAGSDFSVIKKVRIASLDLSKIFNERTVAILAFILAAVATFISYRNGTIVSYGDAESHLNIAKRVVDSLTPGFAQLGGIWLPLPHILMLPFVKFDFLWRTGLAGSIVSGASYIITAVYIFKFTKLLTGRSDGAMLGSLVFMLNPNILYLQTTPMTELTLIVFFTLSSYYFLKYLKNQSQFNNLIVAAFFGFCASLSRYDGWFLVGIEALIVAALNIPIKWRNIFTKSKIWDKPAWRKMEGYLILFGTLAFFGILLWLAWGYLILGDPLYFSHSQFSAKSQQVGWLAQGELPAYKHLGISFVYYLVTAASNIGTFLFGAAAAGLILFLFYKPSKEKFLLALLLNTAFVFNVATLYLGQSVIFIPQLTPASYTYHLFNVRYGVMMVATAAIFFAYFYTRLKPIWLKAFLILILIFQTGMFVSGKSAAISKVDGTEGLSSERKPDAEVWISKNYDGGLVLMDDYARTVSIVHSGIPMQDMIYVGNKPYWEESLTEPQKYATWVIVQQNDAVWKSLIDNPANQATLYKYFVKVYTSPEILIFKRNNLAINN